jgi:hypothetical protein
VLYSLSVDLELARQQWNDGQRRVEETRRSDAQRYGELAGQVELVVAELRGRVGQAFTLAELADAYDGADRWVRELLDEAEPETGPVPDAATVADAAFATYAQGAADYRP